MSAPAQAAGRGRPAWWREVLLVAVTYAAYSATRSTLPARHAQARANAMDLYHLEQRLHLDVERTLNELLSGHLPHGLSVLANYSYALPHFVVTVAVLVWIYVRHASAYRTARNVLLVTTLLGLLGFWLFPLAPPRFFPQLGFVDTIVRDGTWGSWGSAGVVSVSNQYAAMPSIHAAWSLWCAGAVVALARPPWLRALAAAYPVVSMVVVVATANHWLLDLAGGVAAVALATTLVRGLPRLRRAAGLHAVP